FRRRRSLDPLESLLRHRTLLRSHQGSVTSSAVTGEIVSASTASYATMICLSHRAKEGHSPAIQQVSACADSGKSGPSRAGTRPEFPPWRVVASGLGRGVSVPMK